MYEIDHSSFSVTLSYIAVCVASHRAMNFWFAFTLVMHLIDLIFN
jgi:hypothetical protein